MTFYPTVYVNNKPIVLTNEAEKFMMDNPYSVTFLFLKGSQSQNFRLGQKHLEKSDTLGVVIEDESIEELLKTLQETFPVILAGGGVITNPNNEVLMIHRRGKWDLPKGKLDPGESIKSCAEREVKEETGIPAVMVENEICRSYHIYDEKSGPVLKITHWFRMKAETDFKLFPEVGEQITDARWVISSKLNLYVAESYETIKDVLSAANLIK